MSNLLNSPIMVSLELNLLENIFMVIGQAIHTKFSHDDIAGLKKTVFDKIQQAKEVNHAT